MHSDLIARLEAATDDQQRELLIEAYEAIHDGDHPEYCSSFRALRFMRMLDAEAYESAALTLVPEGWTCFHLFRVKGCRFVWEAVIGPELPDYRGQAATPALAICIAALRAGEE